MGVVVTGATSGVGRAVVEALAEQGARVVVSARDETELDELADWCRSRGAAALAVTCDITDAAQVEALAGRADEWLGGIDTWVEAAAVLVAGWLPDVPVDEIDRVIRTNVLGTALCSRAALARFERRGWGVLINVSSLLGLVPNPNVPIYCMTKFAVRGLSIAAHERYGRRSPIRVCTVMPGPIDTPMFDHAANHLGRKLRSIPPAMSPHRVAAAIVRCARRPRRQVTAGFTGWSLLLAHRLAPRTTEWFVAQTSSRLLMRAELTPESAGALFAPPAVHRTSGDYRRSKRRRAVGDRFGRWWARRGAPSSRPRTPPDPS
jgi:NAD(P)-dependent dehydrogenase (short-subunit alcohol dehydrogenase family)